MTIVKQTTNGAFWSFLDILFNKAIYFIATIILAKILGPSEFGILGMIMIFVSIGNSLIDSGMSISIMRSKDPTETDYSTVFIINVGLSIVIYSIMFFISPWISIFYNQPILSNVIRLYCLGFILSSLRGAHTIRLTKLLSFRKILLFNLPGNILGVIVGVYLGINGFGVYSLVFMYLTNQLVSTIIYWTFDKWRPKLIFELSNYIMHLKFGYKLVVSSQLNILFENLNYILLGKFNSPKSLGFYDRANTFNNYPVSILTSVIINVSLPIFSKIKNENEKLRDSYRRLMQISFFITGIGLALLACISEFLFIPILGIEWIPIIPVFQALTFAYVLYPIHALNINIMNLFGRSDLVLKLEIIKKIIYVIIVFFGFNFGLLGLAYSGVISSIIALFINTFYSGKLINYSFKSQILDLFPIFFIIFLTSIIVLLFSGFLIFESNILKSIVLFALGVLISILLSEIFKLEVYFYLKKLIKER